jgi:hypothetical protein
MAYSGTALLFKESRFRVQPLNASRQDQGMCGAVVACDLDPSRVLSRLLPEALWSRDTPCVVMVITSSVANCSAIHKNICKHYLYTVYNHALLLKSL